MKSKKGFMDGYKTYDTSGGFGNRREWKAAFADRLGRDRVNQVLGEDDPLVMLGFTSKPTLVELDRRYRELALRHHPDKGGNAKDFIRVQAAWEKLRESIEP